MYKFPVRRVILLFVFFVCELLVEKAKPQIFPSRNISNDGWVDS